MVDGFDFEIDMKELENRVTELEDGQFIGYNEQGEEQVFSKLLEFDGVETGKHYLVYTDGVKNENGEISAYASTVTELDNGMMHFEPLTSDKEWEVIESALSIIQEYKMDED